MRRAAWIFAFALPLAAQSPTTEGITTRSTTERPNVSASGMEKTLTGVLMDAGCKSIASTRSDLTQMPRTPIAMRQDGQTGAGAQSTQGETARTKTEQEQRSLKVYTPQTAAGPDRASATGTTGAAAGTTAPAAPAAGARTPADDRMPRLTESGRSSATGGPSNASATGTTGAAVATAPAESGNVQSLSTAATRTGDRARTATQSDTASDNMTVREKYSGCMVTPSTTSFAMHAGGQLYVLDRASNTMVQEQMRNEAFQASMANQKDGSQWMTVTVQGTPTSDNTLTIRSVRK